MLPTITVIGTISFMEVKFLPNGKQITSLTVGCSEKRKDGTWDNLNIKAEFWENNAKFVNDYFNDGDVIVVTGKLITNQWEQDGQKRNEIKFNFPQASFPPKSKNQTQQQQPQQNQQAQSYQAPQQQKQSYQAPAPTQQQRPSTPPVIDVDEDEIPF